MSEKNKTVVGLSISDFSAEIVWAKKNDKSNEIMSRNRIFFPEGVVKNGRIVKFKVLSGLFKGLFENSMPLAIPRNEKIFFALPQSMVFTHVFTLHEEEKKDLHEIIKNEADKAIPIKKDEITIVYKKIKVEEKVQKIILFALKQEIISEWNNFFKKNNLFIQRFEIETLAFFRALSLDDLKKPVCLVDIGMNTINNSFFSDSGFLYSQQSQYGGKYISEKLARGLKIDFFQAEEFKKNISLIYESGDNEIAREILNTVFIHIVEEIKNGIKQFKENYPVCGNISKIFLLGGSANTRGIVDFFEKHFPEVEIIPISRIFPNPDLTPEYSSAFGLANIGLSARLQKSELAFLPHSNEIFFKFNIKRFSLIIVLVFAVYFFNFSHKTFFLNAPNLEQEVRFGEEEAQNEKVEASTDAKDYSPKQISIHEAEKEDTLNVIVVIKNIDSSLNVRRGAGMDFEIIGKVFLGQKFIFIQEKSGWYEIKFNENSNGWIFSEYAEKAE